MTQVPLVSIVPFDCFLFDKHIEIIEGQRNALYKISYKSIIGDWLNKDKNKTTSSNNYS